ncbi:MAG: hypothetical protein Q9184_001707 [Pyrenodesmia sp. 2 TL-2023]
MFAVPNWSVPASKLKVQHEPKSTEASSTINGTDKPAKAESNSKKRKRGHGKANGITVTKDNLAELWQKHIEGSSATRSDGDGEVPEKSSKKRRRKPKGGDLSDLGVQPGHVDTQDGNPVVDTAASKDRGANEVAHTPMTSPPPAQNGNQNSKAQRKAPLRGSGGLPTQARPPASASTKTPQSSTKPVPPQPATTTTEVATSPIPPPVPKNHAKLTPLQTAMRAKLVSARFRHINETLYTTPSTYASSLFSSNPEAFASYHAGFRSQVASWPQNPVEIFVQEIRERAAVAGPKSQKQLFKDQKKKRGKKSKEKPAAVAVMGNGVKLEPLPRSGAAKACTILDLGCGDASLQASLLSHTSSLILSLHSFDLSPGDTPNAHLITVCDIAHLPLKDSSADIAIFCLALMGTNWTDFVREAARVVRVGGECWVGEVRSRFVGAKEIEKGRATKKPEVDKKKKKKGREDDEDAGNGKIEVEEEEVGGQKIKEKETDVGPFIDVFRRRGFALKGDVDFGNKMFVRMQFVRIRDAPSAAAMGERRGQQQSSKFIDREEETAIGLEKEAKVLKPSPVRTFRIPCNDTTGHKTLLPE